MSAPSLHVLPWAVLLHDFLSLSARGHPDAIAATAGSTELSYAELEARVNRLASALVKRGVVRGDRVLIFGDNTLETLVGFWAALAADAVAVVVSPLARADRLEYLLEDTRAKALLTHALLAPAFVDPASRAPHLKVTAVEGAVPPEQLAALPGGVPWGDLEAEGAPEPPLRRAIELDLAAIIYTSGSTGRPKGVMHTHQSLRWVASAIVSYLGLRRDDVLLGALPFAFGYGLFQAIAAAAQGARLVLERGFTFPSHVLGRIAEERVTCLAGVPSVFVLFGGLDQGGELDLSSVRIVTNAAAALTAKHAATVKRLFPRARLFSMYGQTECIRGTYVPPESLERKLTSIGVPIPNSEAWVAGEDGERLPPGQVGQLVLRGPHLMRGYWERPDATREKLRPGPVPGESVLFTGDLARTDEDGFFYFVSRMDDIIKSRGEKVSPAEVEGVLTDHAGIREATVIGVDDELLGQAVKAFVVAEPGVELTAKDVQRHCQAHLESHMVPKHVVFVDDLPRTSTGKLNKLGLS